MHVDSKATVAIGATVRATLWQNSDHIVIFLKATRARPAEEFCFSQSAKPGPTEAKVELEQGGELDGNDPERESIKGREETERGTMPARG